MMLVVDSQRSEDCEAPNLLARRSHIVGNALVVKHVPEVPRLLLAASLPPLHAPLAATSVLLLSNLPRHPLAFISVSARPLRCDSRVELISPVCSMPIALSLQPVEYFWGEHWADHDVLTL